MSRTPIADGFRAVFRGPGLVLAEIAWRWSFGTAAWLLIILTFREYLASIRFTSTDWLLIRTRQPFLVAQAVAHAIEGSGARLVKAGLVVTLAMVVFWIAAATVGRVATLKALLARSAKAGSGAVIGLNFLRAALLLAAVIAFFGAVILVGYATPADPADPTVLMARVLLFLLVGVLVGFLWSVVNWFLSVAPIFVLRDGRDTFGAIADSVTFFRRCAGPLTGVTLMFDFFRLLVLVLATVAALTPIGAIRQWSAIPPVTWFVVAIALLYFAVSDFLYITRLAVYVSLAEEEEPAPGPVAGSPEPLQSPEVLRS